MWFYLTPIIGVLICIYILILLMKFGNRRKDKK